MKTTIVILVIILPLLLATKMDQRVRMLRNIVNQDTVAALDYGVLFKKTAVLDMSSSEWPLVIRIDKIPPMPRPKEFTACERLPKIERLVQMLHIPLNDMKPYQARHYQFLQGRWNRMCKAYSTLKEEYNKLQDLICQDGHRQYRAMEDLTTGNTFSDLEMALSTTSTSKNLTKTREKRDLSLVGDIAGNFFGLATTSDLNALKEAVLSTHEGTKQVAEAFTNFSDDMLKITTLQSERIDKISDNLKSTMKNVNTLTETTTQQIYLQRTETFWMDIIDELLIKTFTEVSILQDALMNYRQLIQDRTNAIAWLNDHLLTPSLITPDELQKILTEVEPQLMQKYPPFRIAIKSVKYFYQIPSTSYTSDDKYLYVQIKIPLTVINSHYHTYRIHTMSLPATNGTTQFTQIADLPDFAAFSSAGDTYSLVPMSLIQTCRGIGIQRCPARQLEISSSVDSCVLGLFMKDPLMVKQYCKVDLILTPRMHETALDIGEGKFFVSNSDPTSEWVVACPQTRPRSVKPCRSCIVTLQCRCTLKTKYAFISASLRGCEKEVTTSGLDRAYVPNMMWIQYLSVFQNITIPEFNDTHLDPLTLLPSIQIPEYLDIQEYVDDEQIVRTSLKKVIQKAKDNQPLYLTKLHQISTETRYWLLKNHHAIPISLAAIVWLCILSVLVFCLARKHTMLSTFISGSMIKDVKGCSLGSEPNHKWGAIEYCLMYMIIATTLLLILKILVSLWKFWKKRKDNAGHYPPTRKFVVFTKVYLKLSSGAKQLVLAMDHLYMPQHKLKFERPDQRLPKIRPISSFKGLRLLIDWKDLTLRQTDTGMKIPMLNCINVPANAKSLALIILRQETYTFSIIVTTGPEQREFPPMLLTGQRYQPPDPEAPRPPSLPKKRKRSHLGELSGLSRRADLTRQPDQPRARPGSRRYQRRRESTHSGYLPFVRRRQTPAAGRAVYTPSQSAFAPPVPQPRPRRFSYHEVIEDVGDPMLQTTSMSVNPGPSAQSLPSVIDLSPPTHPDDLFLTTTSDETDIGDSNAIERELDRID